MSTYNTDNHYDPLDITDTWRDLSNDYESEGVYLAYYNLWGAGFDDRICTLLAITKGGVSIPYSAATESFIEEMIDYLIAEGGL